MELPPTQLILIRDHRLEKKLLHRSQTVAIDLPQKILVWEDSKGQVHISYNDPLFLGKRHGLQGLDIMLSTIAQRLDGLANETAGNEI